MPPKLPLSLRGIRAATYYMVPEAHPSRSIGLVVLIGLTSMTSRHTSTQTTLHLLQQAAYCTLHDDAAQNVHSYRHADPRPLHQRFSNWGPRTKGGPRRVPTGSAKGFRKAVIVCTVFNYLRPICFQICTHKSVTQSQCIAWKCCRGLARQAFC